MTCWLVFKLKRMALRGNINSITAHSSWHCIFFFEKSNPNLQVTVQHGGSILLIAVQLHKMSSLKSLNDDSCYRTRDPQWSRPCHENGECFQRIKQRKINLWTWSLPSGQRFFQNDFQVPPHTWMQRSEQQGPLCHLQKKMNTRSHKAELFRKTQLCNAEMPWYLLCYSMPGSSQCSSSQDQDTE